VPLGQEDSPLDNIMMVKIRTSRGNFIHASDIQFLSFKTIKQIIHLKPDIVLASGPPIYLPYLDKEDKKRHGIIF